MIGDKIRELLEADNILLRQLAAQLEMDTAMLSKMERGDHFFKGKKKSSCPIKSVSLSNSLKSTAHPIGYCRSAKC